MFPIDLHLAMRTAQLARGKYQFAMTLAAKPQRNAQVQPLFTRSCYICRDVILEIGGPLGVEAICLSGWRGAYVLSLFESNNRTVQLVST